MKSNLSIVARDILSRLEDPFVRSKTFGRLRWLSDSTLLAAIIALLVVSGVVLLLLIGGRIGTGQTTLYEPLSPTIVEVTLGDGFGDGADFAEATEPQAQTIPSAAMASGVDAIADVDVGEGRTLDASKLTVSDNQELIDQLTEIDAFVAPSTSLGSSGGGGSPGSASLSGIFNVDPNVKTVVFVIDRSGSMSGNPLARVKAELIGAIQRLDQTQSFSVIFFESLAWPVFSQRGLSASGQGRKITMVPAVGADKVKAIDWLNTMPAGGGTNPLPAVMMALHVHPQQICLLSDGAFSELIVDQITRQNAGQTSIRCIGFGEFNPTLQRLAGENNGHYTTAR